jgi:hypothetical protein
MIGTLGAERAENEVTERKSASAKSTQPAKSPSPSAGASALTRVVLLLQVLWLEFTQPFPSQALDRTLSAEPDLGSLGELL